MLIFYGEGFLAILSNPKREDYPLLAVSDCLFSILAATIYLEAIFSILDLRMSHSVVTGTHLTWKLH
jgi:hypothetical protein